MNYDITKLINLSTQMTLDYIYGDLSEDKRVEMDNLVNNNMAVFLFVNGLCDYLLDSKVTKQEFIDMIEESKHNLIQRLKTKIK